MVYRVWYYVYSKIIIDFACFTIKFNFYLNKGIVFDAKIRKIRILFYLYFIEKFNTLHRAILHKGNKSKLRGKCIKYKIYVFSLYLFHKMWKNGIFETLFHNVLHKGPSNPFHKLYAVNNEIIHFFMLKDPLIWFRMGKKQKCWCQTSLTLPVSITDEEKKLSQIFVLTLYCGASKCFLKALMTFIKPFQAPQRSVKIKIWLVHKTGSVKECVT